MRRFWFTIAGLAGVVAVVAVGVAALRDATPLWDNVAFTFALGMLVLATLLAVHRSGERRAFWLGFALAGTAYLGASLVPAVEPRLLTTNCLVYLDSKVSGAPGTRLLKRAVLTRGSGPSSSSQPVVTNVSLSWAELDGDDRVLFTGVPAASVRTTKSFVRIGHSLIALALAIAGGLLSRRIALARGPSS